MSIIKINKIGDDFVRNPENQVDIKKVEYLGKIFKNNLSRVLGHDAAYSIQLDDGRSFWSFGDTLIGEKLLAYDPEKELIDVWLNTDWAKENISMEPNTACFVNAKNAEELITLKPFYIEKNGVAKKIIGTSLAPNRANRYRPIWPMDGIFLNKTIYLYDIFVDCGIFDPSKKEQSLDINLYGAGLSKAEFPYTTFTKLKPTIYPTPPKDLANFCEYPYIWWNCEASENDGEKIPAFGTAVLKTPVDGYVYIYGSRVDNVNGEMVHGVYLSRVKTEKIEDLNKYEYYSKQGWVKQPKNLQMLFDGNANELSISFNPYLNKYLCIYSYVGKIDSEGNIFSGAMEEVHLRTADYPQGPWSDPIVIYKAKKSHYLDTCYAAKEHPEFMEKNGKIIYFTFVSHQRYWPELVRVEFE